MLHDKNIANMLQSILATQYLVFQAYTDVTF